MQANCPSGVEVEMGALISSALDTPQIRQSRLLIVDDTPANVVLLEKLLATAGYDSVQATTDPRTALALYAAFAPDLILLDLHMPELDGFAVMAQLKAVIPPEEYLPIIVLTADINEEARRRALAGGAHDFLTKPFDTVEVSLRITNLLRTRFLHLELARHNQFLEQRVRERTQQLDAARLEILQRLSLAAEYRDDDTGEHTRRVGATAAHIASELGLAGERIELIRQAAPLHDIGKLGVSDAILRKPGKLTPEEFAHVKRHARIGHHILDGTQAPVLLLARDIARTHHERWDGTGYPDGRAGTDIPQAGRIVAVADVYDALIHDRPYKTAWPLDKAVDEIVSQRGRHFDPDVVDAFLRTIEGDHTATRTPDHAPSFWTPSPPTLSREPG
jgi:putative two-component system response regulator